MRLPHSFIKRVSRDWQDAPHIPGAPHYRPFIEETVRQYENLRDVVKLLPSDTNPYATSYEMFQHISEGFLGVFTGGDSFAPNHPLAEESRFRWPTDPLRKIRYNELFRAVHDYYGHFTSGAQFETWEGEVAAYKSHRRVYSADSVDALFAETVGQLAVYFDTGNFVEVQKAVAIEIREVPNA